jgi:hypothetical protein
VVPDVYRIVAVSEGLMDLSRLSNSSPLSFRPFSRAW